MHIKFIIFAIVFYEMYLLKEKENQFLLLVCSLQKKSNKTDLLYTGKGTKIKEKLPTKTHSA